MNIEKQIIDPEIVDSKNIMMITTIDKAKELLQQHWKELKLVFHWIPVWNNEIGIILEHKRYNKKRNPYSNTSKQLRPVINGIAVDWCYPEETIIIALKIFTLMGWEPEIYCPVVAYPLVIRSGKQYSNGSKEGVILIAPNIKSEN